MKENEESGKRIIKNEEAKINKNILSKKYVFKKNL